MPSYCSKHGRFREARDWNAVYWEFHCPDCEAENPRQKSHDIEHDAE